MNLTDARTIEILLVEDSPSDTALTIEALMISYKASIVLNSVIYSIPLPLEISFEISVFVMLNLFFNYCIGCVDENIS